MDIKEAGLIKGDIGKHWYYRAKLAALHRVLPARGPTFILDVGAGLGFFSGSLLQSTNARAATCVDPSYSEHRDDTRMGKPLLFRRSVDRSDADLVLLMDVIEHVEDDVGLVREYVDKVASGTRFIVTVPAFMWLWSGHDLFLEHFRRYNLTGIERVLRAGGLTVELGCYFYAAVLPLVVLSRVAERLNGHGHHAARSQMREFGPVLNAVFWLACRAELPLFRSNRLAGLTVFIRAVK
jgi:2-polyprenyl-3-methyl-5-hydroxy-6-metoxy-1,4-benzoquinol methylase